MEMDPNRIGVLVSGVENFNYSLSKIPKMYGGTGDLFLSLFIHFHFYQKDNFRLAIMKAVDKTHFVIKESFENNSNDLLIKSLAL
jgi:pyridoxal/pyridoxine/pyridoxamine kinase